MHHEKEIEHLKRMMDRKEELKARKERMEKDQQMRVSEIIVFVS